MTRWAYSLLAFICVCVAVFSPAAAQAETRKLKLYFLHTGERAEIAYKRNGKYLPNGLKKVNRFLRDWRRNEPTKMDPKLLDLIWEVHKETGSRNAIHVISAYRSPATNKMLRKRGRGVAKKSQHTLGKALDFFIPGVKLSKLRAIGLKKGLGGVGYYPRSGSPFVHMDTGTVRHWPRMTRKELVRVFPNGKTLHVPTDGKPLPGYNQAKAAYERKIKRKSQIASAEEIEKKPSLLAKIFTREDDEEGLTSATIAPRRVKTKPAAAPKQQEPASASNTPAQQRPIPGLEATPAEPKPAPITETPEIILAALPPASLPIPSLSPRNTVVVENQTEPEPETTIPEQQIAEQDAIEETVAEETIEQQVAALIAVPTQRPAGAENPTIGEAPIEVAVAPTELVWQEIETGASQLRPEISPLVVQDEQPVRVAALSPNEIQDLRAQVYAVLKNNKNSEPDLPQTLTAFASPTQASNVPVRNASKATAEAINNQLIPLEPGAKTTGDPVFPTANPEREIQEEIKVAALSPIEPGVKASGEPALPIASPERKAIEQEVAALEPLEPGTETTGNPALPIASPQRTVEPEAVTVAALEPIEDGVMSTGDVTAPLPSPEKEDKLQLQTVASNIPVPKRNEITIASLVEEDIANSNITERFTQGFSTLESFEPNDLRTRILGKWALENNQPIARIAKMRPPAYGRNALLETPSTVLENGFSRSSDGRVANAFSGSSIEFLDFRRFE